MGKEKQNIARHYKSRKSSDIVNFPLAFRRTALSGSDKDLANLPISSFRIIFKVLNDVSYDQFHPKKQIEQFKLFEEQLLTEHNTFASFSFPAKEVDEHLDYKAIQKGLEALENLNKGWHKSRNSEGKIVKSLGGVITNPQVSEGKVSFLMSSYWIGQLLNMPSYNKTLYETPWKMRNGKHVLFYLWLLEVPDSGTNVLFDKFQEFYDYNYKTAQILAKSALKPMRKMLDKVANRSFNYRTRGNLISIKPYYTKDVELDLDDNTVTAQHITQKLHYWKVRHDLQKKHIETFRSIINLDKSTFMMLKKCYELFIKKCKEEKTKATDYKGDNFLKQFQNLIIDYYSGTALGKIAPNSYPIIKENG